MFRKEQLPSIAEGKEPTLRGSWENTLSGSEIDNVPKETHVVSPHDSVSGNIYESQRGKRPIVFSCTGYTWKDLQKIRQQRSESLESKRKDSLAETKMVKTRHAISGNLPCVRITRLNRMPLWQKLLFSTWSGGSKKPGKSQRRVVLKDKWRYGRSTYNWVVSQDSQPRKSIPKESMKLGSNRAVKVSKKHPAPFENSGKKRSVQWYHSEA